MAAFVDVHHVTESEVLGGDVTEFRRRLGFKGNSPDLQSEGIRTRKNICWVLNPTVYSSLERPHDSSFIQQRSITIMASSSQPSSFLL
jgi:hypothetical protein